MSEAMKPRSGTVVYSTPWFDLVSKEVKGQAEPYYSLRTIDYVCIVAVTTADEVVMVKQYRPSVEERTLELPAGHVELNQTPEEAARSELADETGFTASRFTLLGDFFSDTGRQENRTWCYLAEDLRPAPDSTVREPGIEVVLAPVSDLRRLALSGAFNHGPHVAALMLAALRDERFKAAVFSASDVIGSSPSAKGQ